MKLSERNTLGSTAVPQGSDAFDRIIELLQSAVDLERRSGERICRAADRTFGHGEAVEANPSAVIQPTITSLLGDLERAQAFVSGQLDRFLDPRI